MACKACCHGQVLARTIHMTLFALHRFDPQEAPHLMTWTTLMPIFHRWWDNGDVNFSEGDPCHGKVH